MTFITYKRRLFWTFITYKRRLYDIHNVQKTSFESSKDVQRIFHVLPFTHYEGNFKKRQSV